MVGRFTLTIDTDNAAFAEDRGQELARILRETARRVQNDVETMGFSFAVQDSNGNIVGRAELLDGPRE